MNRLRDIWQTELVKMTNSGNINFDRADIKMPGFEDWGDAPRSVENMVKFKSILGKNIGIGAEELAKSLGELTAAFMNAPTVVFLGLNKTLGSYSMFDLGAFQQSLLLAAEEKNIDSCTAGAFAMFGDVLKEELDIPDNISIAIGIALGYGDKEDKINKRKAMIRMDIDQYARFID
jgi:nitroreductase